ncbi:MAG: hypothetical protein IPJ19_16245 [Planctomycetes bacterium]|nr:hypothetical protein [Planctomycetota bacterium]
MPGLAMLLGFAVLGEVALRMVRFHYPSAAERDVIWSRERDPQLFAKRFYERDEREIWKPVPGAEVPWAPGEHLDPSGFRSAPMSLEHTPGVVRIAVLGSGEALGVGLPREQCWSSRLQQVLADAGERVEVLCAAVEDTTLRQGIERWRAEVRPYRPDLVVCTFAGVMEARAANSGCSDDARIEGNCGHGFPDYRQRARLLPAWTWRLRSVQCCAWIADVLDGDYWTWRAGVLDQERLAPLEDRFDAAGTRRVSWKEFSALLPTLRDEVEHEGGKLLLFPITGERALAGLAPAVRDYHAVLLETAQRQKIAKLSGMEFVEAAVREGAQLEDFYAAGQLTAAGSDALARQIGGAIRPRLRDLRHAR